MKKDKHDQVIAEPSAALAPNTPAPYFTLQATPNQRVSLRDFRGSVQPPRIARREVGNSEQLGRHC